MIRSKRKTALTTIIGAQRAICTLLLLTAAELVTGQQYEPLIITCDSNDHFSDRCQLNGPFVQATASITQATLEAEETIEDDSQSQRSLWWEWTAPRDGWVDLKASSETFTPALSAFKGQSLSLLSQLDGVALEAEATSEESGLSFQVQSGESIQIAVQGPIESSGMVALEIVLRPINDGFQNRTLISLDENQIYLGLK